MDQYLMIHIIWYSDGSEMKSNYLVNVKALGIVHRSICSVDNEDIYAVDKSRIK